MSRAKVSNLVRVKTGSKTIEFELKDNKLTVLLETEYTGTITINEEAVNVLRELLGLTKAGETIIARMTRPSILATELPPDTTRESLDTIENRDTSELREHESIELESDKDFVEGMG